MSKPIIQVEGLSKRYRLGKVGATTLRDDLSRIWGRIRGAETPAGKGEFWALRDVSFNIEAGEVVGIIGRNGAGKSTLLKILSRITEPTSGRAVLRGRVASLLEVGTGFHPDLTGRENVFLNGAILGMKRVEIARRFDEIVAFAEVEKFIDTPVKHYSSGMRVRLAFAVAAYLESEILIVDEVLAVGDLAFQQRCITQMKDLATNQHRTVLVVSHQIQVMQHLCTSGLLFNGGRLVAQGTLDVVMAQYQEANLTVRTERSWPAATAPGNDRCQLLRLQATQLPASESSPPAEAPEIIVEMDVWLARPIRDLCVGFDFVSEHHASVLFRSFQADAEPVKTLRQGINHLRCRVPVADLKAGLYSIHPRIGIHNLEWLVAEAPPLIIHTAAIPASASTIWKQSTQRPGVIAPLLEWEVR